MNQAIELRAVFAKTFVSHLMGADVHAILIGGSVAKGWADDYSDIEIGLFYKTLPSLTDRQGIVERVSGTGAMFSKPDSNGLITDYFFVDGLQVDLWHCSDEVIDRFINNIDTDPLPNATQETLWVIQNGIVLKDSPQLAKWRSKLHFPMIKRQEVVALHLSAITSPDLKLFACRHDLPVYYGLISGIQKRMGLLLFALNGTFSVDFKSLEHSLKLMPIKPENCWERFDAIYKAPLLEGAEMMESLITDTVALVKHHMPEVSTEKKHAFDGHRRQRWVGPV